MIALVDYGAGNLRSVQNALDTLGAQSVIASTPDGLMHADAIIFPGVGAAVPAMAALRARGLDRALRDAIRQGGENATVLTDLSQKTAVIVRALASARDIAAREKQSLDSTSHGAGAITGNYQQDFVHSYVGVPQDRQLEAAETTYGVTFVSAIAAGSMIAVQFHPERSGSAGLRLLGNFVRLALMRPPTRSLPQGGREITHVAQADHSLP